MDLSLITRLLAILGLVLLLVAGLLYLFDRLDLTIGNLPGDIKIEKGNFTCVIPILSSLVISLVLTVLINLVLYFLNK